MVSNFVYNAIDEEFTRLLALSRKNFGMVEEKVDVVKVVCKCENVCGEHFRVFHYK